MENLTSVYNTKAAKSATWE